MVGAILSLIAAFVKLAGAVVGWLHERRLIEAGHAEAIARSLERQSNDIRMATAVRENMRADLVRRPDGLRDDDGFRRPE